jgi:hypothetical protein
VVAFKVLRSCVVAKRDDPHKRQIRYLMEENKDGTTRDKAAHM